MPIFEYVCKQCHHPFEALVMGSQKAACPDCGSKDLEDKFSTYAVRATGSPSAASSMPAGGCGGPACRNGMCGGNN
jgi:putative FmdB family regulatory protein